MPEELPVSGPEAPLEPVEDVRELVSGSAAVVLFGVVSVCGEAALWECLAEVSWWAFAGVADLTISARCSALAAVVAWLEEAASGLPAAIAVAPTARASLVWLNLCAAIRRSTSLEWWAQLRRRLPADPLSCLA